MRELYADCGWLASSFWKREWISPKRGVFNAFKNIGYKGHYMFEAAYPPAIVLTWPLSSRQGRRLLQGLADRFVARQGFSHFRPPSRGDGGN